MKTSIDRVEADDSTRVLRNNTEERPRDKLDCDYLDACKAAGIEPDLARKKQLSLNVVIPVVDRGRRVDGAPLVDERGEIDPDEEEQAGESSEQLDHETARAIKTAGQILDKKLIGFLFNGRKGARIAARLAAIAIWCRRMRPRDLSTHFDPREVTDARLRLATAQLKRLLRQDETKGAS